MINIKEKDKGQFVLSNNGVCIVTNLSGSDILIISYDNYNYLIYNVIKYPYNNNKVKHYVSLCIGKRLKDDFEIPKEKMQWQFSDIK